MPGVVFHPTSDNTGTVSNGFSVTTTATPIVSAPTDQVVLAFLQIDPSVSAPTGVGCTCGGVAMTQLASLPNSGGVYYYIFGRIIGATNAPQTVQASWGNQCAGILWAGIFSGVKQTNISVAFTGATITTFTSGTAPVVTVACSDYDMVVGALRGSGSTSTTDTEIWPSTASPVGVFGAAYTNGMSPSATVHFGISPAAPTVVQAVNLASSFVSVNQDLGTANNLAVGAPTLDTPLCSRSLPPANNLAVGAPTIGVPAFTAVVPPGVNFDAKLSGLVSSTTDPITTTAMTVGTGSNRGLLVGLVFNNTKGADYSLVTNVFWDSTGANQQLTFLGSQNIGTNTNVAFYGLLNPVSGTKTLRATGWGVAAVSAIVVNAIAFTSVNQASLAAAFTNFTGANGTTSTPSVTVTSAADNMVVSLLSVAGSATISSVSVNEWWRDNSVLGAGSYDRSTSSSKTLSAVITSSQAWSMVGVNVVAAITATALTATSLATAAPTLGQPAFFQKQVLPAPNGFTVFPPDVTASVLAQVHALAATPLAVAPPAFSQPLLKTVHTLVANVVAVAAPVIGQGALGQAGVFAAIGFAVNPPTIATATLAQKQVLAAGALAVTPPTLGAPVTSITSLLAANALTVTPPTFGAPALRAVINTAANDLATSSPAITAATLGQKHTLVASASAVGALTFGAPSMLQAVAFPAATALAVQPPIFGAPALGQKHVLVAAWAPVSPALGAAVMTLPTLVTFDSKFSTGLYGPTNSDPANIFGQMTVGTGADRALLVAVYVNNVSIDYSSFISVTWDYGGANQLMTPIGSYGYSSGGIDIILYGLLNPVSGLKNILVQGSGGSVFYSVEAISFINVRQTSIADAFKNFTTATDNTATPNVTVSSVPGDMVTSFFAATGTVTAIDPTEWWHSNGLGGGSYARASGSSVTLGMTVTGITKAWFGVGVDVVLSVINVPLTANGFAVQPPSFSAPVMTVPTQLFSVGFAVQPPTFSGPAFRETNVFAPIAVAVSSPAFGTPAIGQKHVLPLATNLAASSPTLAHPGVFVARVFAAPPAFSTAVPTFGAPALGQKYALIAGYVPVQPGIGVAVLGQKHVLPAPGGFAVASPTVPAAPFGAGRLIAASGLATAALTLSPGMLAQKHVLVAGDLAVSAVALAAAAVGLQRLLAATALEVSSPLFGQPGIDKTAFLTAPGLVLGAPDFGDAPGVGEILPPLVWPLIRLKRWSHDPKAEFYDDDHSQNEGPVKQAIFANLNDEFEFTISQLSLVGRTSGGRGPAETIQTVDPLYLFDRKLFIDWSDVEELQIALLAEIEERAAAIAAEIAARQADIATEIAARTAAVVAEASARGAADIAAGNRLTVLETRSSVDRGYTEILEPVAGFSYACHDDAGMVIIVPSGNLSSGTFILPVNPVHLQRIEFVSTKNVATITFLPGAAGQALLNNPGSVSGGVSIDAVWRSIIGQWIFFT